MTKNLDDKIFELAYKGGELEDYLCGIGPYDLGARKLGAVINTGAIMHKIYTYYAANKDPNLPKAFIDALMNLTQYKSFLSLYVVMNITAYHLWAMNNGRASFEIDCAPIFASLRRNLEKNKHFYTKPGELGGYQLQDGMSSTISFYESKFKQYGYSIIETVATIDGQHK